MSAPVSSHASTCSFELVDNKSDAASDADANSDAVSEEGSRKVEDGFTIVDDAFASDTFRIYLNEKMIVLDRLFDNDRVQVSTLTDEEKYSIDEQVARILQSDSLSHRTYLYLVDHLPALQKHFPLLAEHVVAVIHRTLQEGYAGKIFETEDFSFMNCLNRHEKVQETMKAQAILAGFWEGLRDEFTTINSKFYQRFDVLFRDVLKRSNSITQKNAIFNIVQNTISSPSYIKHFPLSFPQANQVFQEIFIHSIEQYRKGNTSLLENLRTNTSFPVSIVLSQVQSAQLASLFSIIGHFSIKELVFESCHFDEDAIDKLGDFHSSGIKKIVVKGGFGINSGFYGQLSTIHSVEEISIENLPITDEQACPILSMSLRTIEFHNCPSLALLDLDLEDDHSVCSEFSGEDDEHNLQGVDIAPGEPFFIDADGTTRIGIENLVIDRCPNVTNESLRVLASNLRELKIFKAFDCNKITDEGLNHIRLIPKIEQVLLDVDIELAEELNDDESAGEPYKTTGL